MDFNTEGISFTEKPYEAYIEQVDKELPSLFLQGRTEFLRIPPVYRERVVEYLKTKLPGRRVGTYESSGIIIYGNSIDNLRYAISEVKKGIPFIECEFLEEVADALGKEFPNMKFEVKETAKLYDGLSMRPRSEKLIIVNDYNPLKKAIPPTYVHKDVHSLVFDLTKDINKGCKFFLIEHNKEEALKLLRKSFPERTFEIKLCKNVMPWLAWESQHYKKRKDDFIFIVDNFTFPEH